MQQSPRDLNPPALPAAQTARLVATLLGKPDAVDLCRNRASRFAMRQAVQGTMIEQVLFDGEIEIEGWLLERDPHLPQALQHPLANVHAKDPDRPFALGVEPGGE